jgi:glutathione synthase/RimK-type ligase-like ATP-grasp enzyme
VADVLIATCAELPKGDDDYAGLSLALTEQDVASEWVSWDDPAVDWAQSLVVIRSTWDYTARREQFLAWARSVPRLCNPVEVVEWNSDKTYLRDLGTGGVPVVPTAWSAPGEPVVVPDAGEFVIKPSVGAGSRGAGRFRAGPGIEAAVREHAAGLHRAGRTVMVQPYLGQVDSAGESALIYIEGQFSHCVRKGAMLPEGVVHGVDSHSLYVPEVISARPASPAELEVAEQTMAVVRARFGSLLYARVDLLPSPDGPRLVELELTEPSLFLTEAPGSADRLAAAIAARLVST